MINRRLANTTAPGVLFPLLFSIVVIALVSCNGPRVDSPISTVTTTEVNIIEPGSGDAAQNGSVVAMEYTGYLADGTEFERSTPSFCFTMGNGRVINGLENSLMGQKQRAKLEITVPPHEAYGERGIDGMIPPNETLTYVVRILSVLPKELTLAALPDAAVIYADTLQNVLPGINSMEIKPGWGNSIEPGKTAHLHYTCWAQDGRKFNSTIKEGNRLKPGSCEPLKLSIPLASGEAVLGAENIDVSATTIPLTNSTTAIGEPNKGLEMLGAIIEGMKVGGARLIFVEDGTATADQLQSRLSCDSRVRSSILVVLVDVE